MANSSELRYHATVGYIIVCAIEDFKDLEPCVAKIGTNEYFDWLVFVKKSFLWFHFLTAKIHFFTYLDVIFDIKTRFIYTHSEAHVPTSAFHIHSQRRPMYPPQRNLILSLFFQWNLGCCNLEIALM